jgi:hypothetical protein
MAGGCVKTFHLPFFTKDVFRRNHFIRRSLFMDHICFVKRNRQQAIGCDSHQCLANGIGIAFVSMFDVVYIRSTLPCLCKL